MRLTVTFLGILLSLLFLTTPKPTEYSTVIDAVNDMKLRESVKLYKYPERKQKTTVMLCIAEVIPEVSEPAPEPEKPEYSEDDLYCLAAVICCEAGGESEEAQLMVGNVVLNRVLHKRYSDTIREVLEEPYQYGTMWKYGIKFPKWATEKTIKKCYAVA